MPTAKDLLKVVNEGYEIVGEAPGNSSVDPKWLDKHGVNNREILGAVMMSFVDDPRTPPQSHLWILEKDGWFRKELDPGKGYGLMLRGLTLNNRAEPVDWASHKVYKVKATYLPSSFANDPDADVPANYETDPMWLYVKKGIQVSEILAFINTKIKQSQYVP